jgi:hypothetical protein
VSGSDWLGAGLGVGDTARLRARGEEQSAGSFTQDCLAELSRLRAHPRHPLIPHTKSIAHPTRRSADNVKVTVDDGVLVIKGERNVEREEKEVSLGRCSWWLF